MIGETEIILPRPAAVALWQLYTTYMNEIGGTEPCDTCQSAGAVTQYDLEDERKMDDAVSAVEVWEQEIQVALGLAAEQVDTEGAKT